MLLSKYTGACASTPKQKCAKRREVNTKVCRKKRNQRTNKVCRNGRETMHQDTLTERRRERSTFNGRVPIERNTNRSLPIERKSTQTEVSWEQTTTQHKIREGPAVRGQRTTEVRRSSRDGTRCIVRRRATQTSTSGTGALLQQCRKIHTRLHRPRLATIEG